jgi:hypothetical protein
MFRRFLFRIVVSDWESRDERLRAVRRRRCLDLRFEEKEKKEEEDWKVLWRTGPKRS